MGLCGALTITPKAFDIVAQGKRSGRSRGAPPWVGESLECQP